MAEEPTEPPVITIGPCETTIVPRLPSATASSVEAALAEANERRVLDARARIGRDLLSFDDIVDARDLSEVDNATSTIIGPAFWADIDEHLLLDDCRSPRLDVIGDSGGSVELPCRNAYDLIRPDLGAMAARLEDQVALAVRNLDAYSMGLSRLAADLETCCAQKVQIDALVCGPDATFRDAPDEPLIRVLVVADGQIEISGAAVESRRCTAGTRLVVPADLHVTVTVLEGATLLRIPVPLPSFRSLRALAVANAQFHPLLRADLPAELDRPHTSYGGSLYESPGRFVTEAAQALAGPAMDGAIARLRSAVRPRPQHDPLSVLTSIGRPEITLRSTAHGGVMVSTLDDQDLLIAGGHQLGVAVDVTDDLIPLLDGRSFLVSEVLATAAAPDRLAEVITELSWVDLFEIQDDR